MMLLRIRDSLSGGLCVGLLLSFTAAQNHGQVEKETSSSSSGVSKPAAESKSTDVPAATDKTKSQPRTPDDLGDYIIGEQDSLMINVWKEPEVSGQVVVRPDGKITVPFVNELYVVGLTPMQLQSLLLEKLKPFITEPQVTVTVRDINSYKVYLIGHVAREGEFRINNSTTVFQILAEAGGPSDFAKRKKIYVLRNVNGKRVRYPFNYDEVVQGKNMQQDVTLRRGDTIVVP